MKVDEKRAPMSMEEARAVAWPFRDYRGGQRAYQGQPIGKLLDQGFINRRDLLYAVENAWDKRVVNAARTILLDFLAPQSELSLSPGSLNLISSEHRSFAERRQMQFAILIGFISGIVMGIYGALITSSLFFRSNSETDNQTLTNDMGIPYQIIVLLIALIMILGILFIQSRLFDFIFTVIEKQMVLYRKGQLGEERVINVMYHVLDGQWWLFKNLEIPGYKQGDIDLILVGPSGIWCLEVKSFSGQYRTVGDQWERLFHGQWLPLFKSPTRQAKRNAATLARILTAHDIKQWVNPVIIWANPDSKIVVENATTHIWHLNQLSEELKKIQMERLLSKEQYVKTTEVFKGLYQEPSCH